MDEKEIKKAVRKGYAGIAKKISSCYSPGYSTENISKKIGYTQEEIGAVPEGANLNLGCGNPLAFASLKEGETVLDLGSGAGFDSFLAAKKVGKSGKVIGVDMTPEMIEKARENAKKGSYGNVEFRLGEIESLPVAENSVDMVISNCVINLSPDKKKVFREAFRVLKPGGQLMVSDLVLVKELPGCLKNSIQAYVGCLAGTTKKDEYLRTIRAAGFQEVRILEEAAFPVEFMANDPTAKAVIEDLNIPAEKLREIAGSVVSIKVFGSKPK
ncbi:MAG: arsenite methyltransferase [Candidatus Ratteibacteria bacterium]|jgi:ubiquinone/menaquinone biosynthesis C-methylase UbiE